MLPGLTGRARWSEAPAPPIYEGGSAPCDPLRRSSPFPTLSSPKSRDRTGRLVPTSLRSTLRSARDATPVAWCLPVQPGSKRAILRAPMALKIVRLAAADFRNGRRRCPQAHPVPPPDGQHIDHPREPPTTVMGGGERPNKNDKSSSQHYFRQIYIFENT